MHTRCRDSCAYSGIGFYRRVILVRRYSEDVTVCLTLFILPHLLRRQSSLRPRHPATHNNRRKQDRRVELLARMGLNRRTVISNAGVGVLATVAGCSGSDGTGGIGGGLSVESVNAQTTSFGNVVLTVSVSNSNSSSKSSTLVGQVDVSGGDTYTERREITVTGDSSSSFELEFDIAISESLSSDQYEYDAQLEG